MSDINRQCPSHQVTSAPDQDEPGLDQAAGSRRTIVKFVRQTELYMKHDVTGKQDLNGLVTCY